MNKFCKECVSYFQKRSTSLDINLLKMNSTNIGNFLECKNESSLFYAPAGNFPTNPIVTVCGLATSVSAKDIMQCNMSNQEYLENTCLQAVYHGSMAVNLGLMLKAIGVSNLIGKGVQLTIQKDKKMCDVVSMKDLDVSHLGRSGWFKKVPEDLHLTQATCCWSKQGKSTYQEEWSRYSEKCRELGYLNSLLLRFINSDKSRVLIFLGKQNLANLKNIEQLVDNYPEKKIHIQCPKGWKTLKGKHSGDPDKLICFIHHPANTSHIFNNCKNESSASSLLYKYYVKGDWDFKIEKYGNVTKPTVESNRNYYETIYKYIEKLSKDI